MSEEKDQHLAPSRRASQPESVSTETTATALHDKDAPKHHIDVPPPTPPYVGPFGGASPEGYDAELGLAPARSRAEAESNREAEQKIEDGDDPWVVTFDEGDKRNPKNWSNARKWYITILTSGLVFNSSFASSAPSGITQSVKEYFHISNEVAVLCISLFVAGYILGPILWGPLSEVYGRRIIFILSFVLYTGFQVGAALSKNTASILVFRFLGGTFAAAPLTNSGACLADIYHPADRGPAMGLFAVAPFAGPSIGPIVSGFIQTTHTNWRWLYWVLTIFAGACLALIVFTLPETYPPVILARMAKQKRKETGEDRWYAPLERRPAQTWGARVNEIILKPFVILALEPMLLAITLYMSFIYGIIYLLFEAFPFVFIKNHGFNAATNGLAFLGFFMGGNIAALVYITVTDRHYRKHVAAIAPEKPAPEVRLLASRLTSLVLAISMFWFAWTSYPSVHWISPVLATALLGFAVQTIFVGLFNYIIDVYLWVAASALAGVTVVRAAFGAGFPLFASQMYERLGTQWASCLLAFLALVMAPIPFVLIKYGPALRARSKFSPT
ncbi:hypothetical protein Q8F55_001801 [Vanrija albida]|uniref:Major facilitator superfamily (MFS) profile domain-containing protein n=1 Tax=Vanrija albida TaxID=181172 RepID=A0ABR3Q7Z6_9TREE